MGDKVELAYLGSTGLGLHLTINPQKKPTAKTAINGRVELPDNDISVREIYMRHGLRLGDKELRALRLSRPQGVQAIDAMVARLDRSAAEMFARLRKLHGVEDTAASGLQLKLEEKFVVQQTIDTPQAGMAGAATGAAMGASVDLLVGGLTLGAATALGALVGGSAAFIAAAWKNRASPSGGTLGTTSNATLTIADDDGAPSPGPALDPIISLPVSNRSRKTGWVPSRTNSTVRHSC